MYDHERRQRSERAQAAPPITVLFDSTLGRIVTRVAKKLPEICASSAFFTSSSIWFGASSFDIVAVKAWR